MNTYREARTLVLHIIQYSSHDALEYPNPPPHRQALLFFLSEDNYFTMLCWFLPYNSESDMTNQEVTVVVQAKADSNRV